MSVVASYHIFVCVLFLAQGGMWTESMGKTQCLIRGTA